MPLYALATTLRHEASHAIVVVYAVGKVTHFVFWPTYKHGRGFLWGYIDFNVPPTRLITAAPYLCDLIAFIVFFSVCRFAPITSHALWLNLVVLGVLSPLVNSGYNYVCGFLRPNDVWNLRNEMPSVVVHMYFVTTIAVYAVGAIALLCS